MKLHLLILAFLIPAVSCRAPFPERASLGEDDERLNVAFVTIDGVYNTELTAPFDIFQHSIFHTQPGMRVFTVGRDDDVVESFEGLRVLPDYSFDTCPRVDVLVVPSAEHNMDTDLDDERLLAFVRRKGAEAEWLVSLCDGAFVLAAAGLLDGLESTTFPSDIAAYRKRFPDLVVHEDVSFVHDGKAITSAGGALSFDAALYLCELLYGNKAARGMARGLCIDWDATRVPHVVANESDLLPDLR